MTNKKIFSGAAIIIVGITLACSSPTEPSTIPTVQNTLTTPVKPTPPVPPPVTPDTTTFAIPDVVFVSALIRLGLSVVNGRMLVRDALTVTGMTIGMGDGYNPPEGGLWTGTRGEYITDLTGLEQFKNLKTLRIEHQKVTTVPLQMLTNLEQLSLWGNPLTTIDVKSNTKLTMLGLSETGITEVDLSTLSNLEIICFQNNSSRPLPYTLTNGTVVRGFKKIDLLQNPKISHLYIWNDGLTDSTLLLPTTKGLIEFWAERNRFTKLDFSNYLNLTHIIVMNNMLQSLDLRNIASAWGGVPLRVYTTGNPYLLTIRVTHIEPLVTRSTQDTGGIFIDPWTRFIP